MINDRRQHTGCRDAIDRVRNRIFTLLLLFFFSTVLFSQSYLVHHYTEMEGLPTANVFGITQDHWGRVWFATRGGITVYDGTSWKTYTVSDGLPVLAFHAIQTDQKGRIWALSDVLFKGPVVVYLDQQEENDRAQWHRVQGYPPAITGAKSMNITSFQLLELKEDTKADLPAAAVGTSTMGLFLWHRGEWKNLNEKNGLLCNSINGMVTLGGKLYMATDKGLSIINIHRNSKSNLEIDIDNLLNQSLHLPPGKIKGIGIRDKDKYRDTTLKSSRIWLYSHHWLGYFEESRQKMTLYPVKIPLAQQEYVVHLLPDYRSGVYVGNIFSINYFNYKTRSWETLGWNSDLISLGANGMFIDFEKNIWISCDRGVNKIASRRFGNFQMKHGLLEDEVSALLEYEPGKFVLGHNNGITIYDDGKFLEIPLPQNIKSGELPCRVLDMQSDSKGDVWLALSWGGLGKINPRTIRSPAQLAIYGQAHGLPEGVICLWYDKHRDRLFVGTSGGIFSRGIAQTNQEPGQRFVLYPIGKFPPPFARRIYGDSGKLRYIACHNEGLYVYVKSARGDQWKNYRIPGDDKANNVFTVKKDSSGRLFIGTLAGLFILENETLKKFEHNGFQVDRPVYFILEDKKTRLWFGTNNGVIRWDGKTKRIYTTAEGLSGLETNRTAAVEDSRGRIWIGTNRGVSIYREEFDDNESLQPQPKVQLLTLEAPGKRIPLSGNQPVQLAYKENTIWFYFRGISFLDEKAVRFKHRLEGFEKEWSTEQYLHNQMIRYTNLPPGAYHFYLKAKNAMGTWSSVVISPKITILKPFYKKWWFYALLVLAAGIVLFLIFQFFSDRRHKILLAREVEARTHQLHAVEQRYYRLFEESKDVVFITTPEGKVIDVNPAGVDLLGFRSREELLTIESIAYFYNNPEERHKFREEIEKKGYVKDFEVTYKRKDGELVTALLTSSVERDETGKITAYRGIARDITEQKKLEEQLIQARKMEAIGTLAGGIAHDFNNILAVIMGQAELVGEELHGKIDKIEGPQIDWIRKSAGHIVTAADRGAELVRQILTFSRQSKKERKPIRLSSIITDSLSLMRSILPATIEIRRDIRAGSHFVLADPTQIRQIMLNFGTNAAHAMRETGGALDITLEEANLDAVTVKQYNGIDSGMYLRLTVSDTGHGMSPGVMKRIFDPYFTTKKTGEGTGMGLAVIHGIVKGYGGDISVQSQPGKGTTFQILLPCIVDTEKEPTGKFQIEKEIPGGNERILVVDDEIRLLDTISQILGKKGYQVKGISDPREALITFKEKPGQFDLIISDVTMPHMTGIQLAREFKRFNPGIPIILCSGFGSIITRKQIEDLGVNDFITKPINKIKLTMLVRKVLDSSSVDR
jgi:two-component system cell cycle sensor histidine kinase/response regulator CckA